ncbi:MAG: hypothetical protein H7X97_05995 [Opitutaceae bacterium]|nr:hypothetical protein [Verrucomicrobiales bacterium]
MQPEPDNDLERLIHRELRGLPDLPAPKQLSASVMVKIAAREQRAWWRQPWLNWPLPMRVVSMTLSLSMLALAGWWTLEAWTSASAAIETANRSSVMLVNLRDWVGTLGDFGEQAISALPRSYMFIGAGVLAGLYLACIGLGTVFFRLLFQPREELTS